MIIATIRKRGEFEWNNNPELNCGEYAVSRRPNKKFRKNPWDLVACPECLGRYTRNTLSRHWNTCAKNTLKNERVVQQLCLNYSPHYQQGYICSKLRAAAKVLHVSKSISSEVTDLSSLFHVKHCNTVVEAIRIMGKFDRQNKLFGSPGTASTTVTLTNTVGELLVTEVMKSDEPEKERDAERFLKVFQSDVRTKINKLVSITKAKNRRKKS